MFVLGKVSARLCKVCDRMAPSKYFSSFAGIGGLTIFMILLLCLIGGVVGGRIGSIRELELEKHNVMHYENLPIKTIQSEDGDIIDCVGIQTQPALNHPLLKNHSIQMRPSFSQTKVKTDLSSKPRPVKQIWQKSGSCPVGTIPILRNTKEGLSKAIPITSYGGQVAPNGRQESTIAYCSQSAPYYGARARLNVWNVLVEPNEFNLNFVGIRKNDAALAGWAVYPNLFGDNKTRLFNYWANQETACFNLGCPGFVQVSSRVALGASIGPLSIYGSSQYSMPIDIIKDDAQSSWWLFVLGEKVGYWPVSIFSGLNEASTLVWEGAVYNSQINGKHTSTQMGSGHHASEGFSKAAYMRTVQAMTSAREFVDPAGIAYFATNPGCYSISWPASFGPPGASFYFGGPGGSGCA